MSKEKGRFTRLWGIVKDTAHQFARSIHEEYVFGDLQAAWERGFDDIYEATTLSHTFEFQMTEADKERVPILGQLFPDEYKNGLYFRGTIKKPIEVERDDTYYQRDLELAVLDERQSVRGVIQLFELKPGNVEVVIGRDEDREPLFSALGRNEFDFDVPMQDLTFSVSLMEMILSHPEIGQTQLSQGSM